MPDKVKDLIIIGAGPAGITSAVYAARKGLDFIVLTGDIGGQAAWSSDIENYTGYQFISGPELTIKFEEHMKQYAIDIRENEPVDRMLRKDNGLIDITTAKEVYSAKTVIIASGKRSRELGVPEEKEFRNKGLAYCATCDGPFFAGKKVAVIGGGNSALDAALQLMRIAEHVYVVNNTSELGGDAVMRNKVVSGDKVTVLNNAQVKSISGETFVTGMDIEQEGKPAVTIAVEGVFVEIGLIPNSGFIEGVDKNDQGEIKVDCRNRTSIPGIFAAGDVTDVPEKQIIIAAGEGAKALLSASRYLAEQE